MNGAAIIVGLLILGAGVSSFLFVIIPSITNAVDDTSTAASDPSKANVKETIWSVIWAIITVVLLWGISIAAIIFGIGITIWGIAQD